MKKLAALILSSAVALMAEQGTNRLYLAWDSYPISDTNPVTFHIYSTTNVALPLAQWGHLTNVDYATATNAAKAGEGGRVEVLPAEGMMRFYTMTASNFTGQSDFSESVSVRRLLAGQHLRLGAF